MKNQQQPTLDQFNAAERERQELIKQAHCLVAVIANKPGATRLLKALLPTLQAYAHYKSNRAPRQRISF